MRAHFLSGWLFLLGCAVAGTEDLAFVGHARSLDSGQLLYVERHFVSRDPVGEERRLVVYQCATGAAPFARKELVFGADRNAPTFTLVDARSGVFEGLAREGGGWRVFVRGPQDVNTRSAMLGPRGPRGPFVADAGFDEFVRGNWEPLAVGTALEVPFLVPSRLGTLPFRVRKVRADRVADEPMSVFRLSLAGPLGWILPDIEVSYRDRDRRLMRYRGLTNIRDASGAMVEAEIEFPDVEADASNAEDLRTMPLSAKCG